MLRTALRIKKINKCCNICSKGVSSGFNKPHSLHKTKRMIKPNLQKKYGVYICTNCLKNLVKSK